MSCGSGDGDEYGSFEHGVALGYGDGCHLAVDTGLDGVFHFHGLEGYDCVGCLDFLAYGYVDVEHGAGQRSFYGGASCCGSGGGLRDYFFAGGGAGCGCRFGSGYLDGGGSLLLEFNLVGGAVYFNFGYAVVDVADGYLVEVAVDFIFILFHCCYEGDED